MNSDTIGIDVSKDHLDAHRLTDNASRRFANDKAGHKAFLRWFAEKPAERIVFEPTGPYHRAIERAIAAAGVPFVKVNPRQARRFAEATGKLAKTDRLDAAMLARMGAMLQLQPRPPRREVVLELKELHVAREALVKDRTAAKNRGKIFALPLLRRQNAHRLQQIERQIEDVEAAMRDIVQADHELAARFAILTSIPGVSAVTAFALLVEIPNSARLRPARRPVSQDWRLSHASQVAGQAALSSAEAAPASAKRSTCPRLSRCASTRTLRPSTSNSSATENLPKSP